MHQWRRVAKIIRNDEHLCKNFIIIDVGIYFLIARVMKNPTTRGHSKGIKREKKTRYMSSDFIIDPIMHFRLSRRPRCTSKSERYRLRKILHAEPPLNPLHRVEMIFARIFLVFRPSSRIEVQGSLALLLPALACSFSLAEPSPRILAPSPSVCQFIFVSLFPSRRAPPRPVSRPRSCAASERARAAASACISRSLVIRARFQEYLQQTCLICHGLP